MITKLKLYEFYTLDQELNGVVNQEKQEVVSKGLLSENLKFVLKYHLSALSKKVTEEKKDLEALKGEIIKKYGKEDKDGQASIPMYIFDEEKKPIGMNPDYLKFAKEWEELLQEEKGVDHFEFNLDHFSKLESDGRYDTFFKLVSVPAE